MKVTHRSFDLFGRFSQTGMRVRSPWKRLGCRRSENPHIGEMTKRAVLLVSVVAMLLSSGVEQQTAGSNRLVVLTLVTFGGTPTILAVSRYIELG